MVVFLFSVFWLHVNEFNSLWGDKGGRGQKFVAYSDVIFTMLNLFLFLYFGSRRNECNSLWEGPEGYDLF